MYRYLVIFINGFEFEFESMSYIGTLYGVNVNGATMVFFEDAEVGFNMLMVKELRVDGASYRIGTYTL